MPKLLLLTQLTLEKLWGRKGWLAELRRGWPQWHKRHPNRRRRHPISSDNKPRGCFSPLEIQGMQIPSALGRCRLRQSKRRDWEEPAALVHGIDISTSTRSCSLDWQRRRRKPPFECSMGYSRFLGWFRGLYTFSIRTSNSLVGVIFGATILETCLDYSRTCTSQAHHDTLWWTADKLDSVISYLIVPKLEGR